MKKIFLTVAIFATSFMVLNAQVRFGIKAGLNNSTLGGDGADFSGKKSNTAVNAGVFANIPFSEHFSFKPELMYSSNEGMEFRPAATTEVNYNLNYLNVPLMIQFKSDGGFYGEAGPYVGFLLSGKYKQNVSGVKSESDIKDYFKSTDLGAALGIGYMMKSGFGIGARYNMGLSNIYDASSLELKNRFWQLNLLYTFNNTANHAGAKDKAKKAAKGKM